MSKKGQFKKGNIPWNKGMKGLQLSPESVRFKSGPEHTGENHPSWKGGIEHMSKDCVHINTGAYTRVRRPRKIYEENFGEIPYGYVVIHKDDNRYNDSPDNLEAISRAENLKRNQLKNKLNANTSNIKTIKRLSTQGKS